MPDDVMRNYSARQIAEVMAYYRIKAEDRAIEEQQQIFRAEQERRRSGKRRR